MISTKWFVVDDDLTDAHEIRRRVFIQEQGISEEDEMDGTDDAFHLVAYDGGKPVATGRLRVVDGEYILGRIATLPEERGKGYGDLVVRMLIRRAYNMGGTVQRIHSQISARSFYEKLGFVAYGDEYTEAGVPHVDMEHTGDVSGHC